MEIKNLNEQLKSRFAIGYDYYAKRGNSSSRRFLKSAAPQVQAWLMSLKVRILWGQNKVSKAASIYQEGILLVQAELQESPNSNKKLATLSSSNMSSLFPLVARLWRWMALCLENDATMASSLRVNMAKAHNMALL